MNNFNLIIFDTFSQLIRYLYITIKNNDKNHEVINVSDIGCLIQQAVVILTNIINITIQFFIFQINICYYFILVKSI